MKSVLESASSCTPTERGARRVLRRQLQSAARRARARGRVRAVDRGYRSRARRADVPAPVRQAARALRRSRSRCAPRRWRGCRASSVSRVEEELGGESKTLRTLEHLAASTRRGSCGSSWARDLLPEAPRWFRFDAIRAIAPPLVLGRAGVEPKGRRRRILPAISSTDVRAKIAARDWDAARAARAARGSRARPRAGALRVKSMRVFIFGAGKVGRAIAQALRARPGGPSRDASSARKGLPKRPIDADLLILAVRDRDLAACRGARAKRARDKAHGVRPRGGRATAEAARAAARRERRGRADAPDDFVRVDPGVSRRSRADTCT